MTPKTFTVTYEHAEPEPVYCEFMGERLKLVGTFAWLYRAFKVMEGEETAQRNLGPWLMDEVMKKRNGAARQDNAVPSL